MALGIEWRIPRIWKNENGYITTVEFVMEYTEDTYPGYKSTHAGVINISPAALLADTATREDIGGAIMDTWTGSQFDALANFHIDQIRFEYERANSEMVELDPVETETTFPDLTARQLRIGLITNSIDPDTVTATIDAMPEGMDKQIAQTEWNHASTYERNHPLITQIGGALGLSEEQIDAMWMAASQL